MADFFEQIDQTARALQKAGIRFGTRVAILGENGPAYAAVIGACLRIGAVAVPISTRYRAPQVRQVVDRVGCLGVLASRNTAVAASRGPLAVMEEITGPVVADMAAVTLDRIGADLGNQASIIMTSGSRGEPRGVLHRLSQHYYSAAGSDRNIAFGPEHTWLMSVPMYHVSGFSILMRAFFRGGRVVFPPNGQTLQQAVLQCDATHLSVVPVQLARLMDHPDCIERLTAMEAVLLGGSAACEALVRRALAADLPIHTTYGSTEAASQVTTTARGELAGRVGAGGRLLPYRKLRIAEDGEILLGGRTLFDGYVEAGSVRPALDADGWFHSGDIGALDEAGFLYVRGRKDSMFISGGENIYPEQIEQVLEEAPGVERAVVVALPCGDMGQRPVVFVKMRTGEPPAGETLKHWVAQRLERFKTPVAFLQWPAFLDRQEKPNRTALAARAQELLAGLSPQVIEDLPQSLGN